MRLSDPEQLEQVGLTLYERKALMALMLCGVADAATLCREGSVPSSKIYLAMEKLAGLGLVQVQPTRPKMFAALPSEVVVARIIEIARERSERFAAQASELQTTFTGLQSACAADTHSSIWRWASRATFDDTSCPWRRPGSGFCRTWRPAI
jgi:sugar-specific transcriptional regulator TrmB